MSTTCSCENSLRWLALAAGDTFERLLVATEGVEPPAMSGDLRIPF
jgi:hypothetical protein